jgi:hypothetical protein
MRYRIALLVGVLGSIVMIGAGCGGSKAVETPAAEQRTETKAAAPAVPALPRMTEQPLDEDDRLDEALKELDAVE